MLSKSDLGFYTIIVLTIFVFVNLLRADYYKHIAESLEIELNVLKVESQQLKLRYASVESQAATEMTDAQKQVNGIMTTTVSSDCDEAITWGIEEAKGFA